jgi:hypothetical protein
VQPNTQLLTTDLDTWHNLGHHDAEAQPKAVLLWMLDTHQKHCRSGDVRWSDTVACPNEYNFAVTLAAWSKSQELGKAVRAYALLRKRQTLHDVDDGPRVPAPNAYCYTAVLNACAHVIPFSDLGGAAADDNEIGTETGPTRRRGDVPSRCGGQIKSKPRTHL